MQRQVKKYKIYFGVLILGIIWGSTWLAIKFGLDNAPPFFSAALRFILAFSVLFIWQKTKGYKFPRSLEYWRNSIFISLFMFIIPYAMVYWGEQYISSGLSAVLFSSQSLFVVIFAHIILKTEKVDAQKLLGLFVGFVGLGLIFQGQISWDETWGFIGMIALLFGAACAALGLVLLSKQKHKVDPIPEVMTHIGITAIAFVLLSLIFEKPPENIFVAKLWISVIYLAIPGTAFGFIVYYWLTKHTTAFLTSFCVFISPVFAVFLGWLVLNETISNLGILGALLVIIGIVITQVKKNTRINFNPFSVKKETIERN